MLNSRWKLDGVKLLKLVWGMPTICSILETKAWNWIKSFASTESHTFSKVTGHFYISLWPFFLLFSPLKGVTPLVWHPCDTILRGFWTGVLTGFFRFLPPYSKYFGFSSFLNVSLVVRDRLGQCSIEKKVCYAKNDHGNHLKDGHQPDHGIHRYDLW
jgi:hypothetical protein